MRGAQNPLTPYTLEIPLETLDPWWGVGVRGGPIQGHDTGSPGWTPDMH